MRLHVVLVTLAGYYQTKTKYSCRCDYDRYDCVVAEKLVGAICQKVAYKQCCIDYQETFKFCDSCYGYSGHHVGYSIEYLENVKAKAESSWCNDAVTETTSTTWCPWWKTCSDRTTWSWTTFNTTTYLPGPVSTSTTTTSTTTASTSTSSTSSVDSTTTTASNECPDRCSRIFDPVCGSDMVSYPNLCFLQKKMCLEKVELTYHEGVCGTTSSTTTITSTTSTTTTTRSRPTRSATTTTTTTNSTKPTNSTTTTATTTTSTTTTSTTSTPFKYEAWIGDGECDDVTNVAEWNYDGHDCCQVPLVKGSCLDCLCKETSITTTVEPPTNASTDATFETPTPYTMYEYTETTTTSTTETDITTTECSQICPEIWAPVCGTDMVTYANECELNVAKCNGKSDLEKDYDWSCGGGTTDDMVTTTTVGTEATTEVVMLA